MLDPTATFERLLLKTAAQTLAQLADSSALPTTAERDQALHVLSFALESTATWLITRELLLTLAPMMEQLGYQANWAPYLERGILRSQAAADTEAEAMLHLHLALLYQLRSNYSQAIEHAEKSRGGFTLLNHWRKQAEALNRSAYIRYLQRDFIASSRLVEQAGDLLPPDEPTREFTYFVQAVLAEEQGELDKAVEFLQASLALCQKAGDRRKAAARLGALGVPLQKLKRFPEAIAAYTRAIDLLGEVQDALQQAVMRMNLGAVYLLEQQPEQALRLCQLAEPIIYASEDSRRLALLTLNLGIAYRELQQLAQAEQYLLASVARWQELQNLYWLGNTLDELGLVYVAQKHNSEAKAIFDQAVELLSQIKDQPGSHELLTLITQHREQLL